MIEMALTFQPIGSAGKEEEAEGKRTRRARCKFGRPGVANRLSAHRNFDASSGNLWRLKRGKPLADQLPMLAPQGFESQ